MQKRITTLLVSNTETLATGREECISTGATERYAYLNGERTETKESVILTALSQALGEIQLVFSYRAGFADKLNQQVPFGSRFAVSDIGTVLDVKVGIYNNALTIKFLMQEG